jgi:regulator of sigma E protease
MDLLVGALGTLLDLALVIFGFGLVVLFHELGHFIAARWAGVRVLAFAFGFGPALLSYRAGLGWRRGSSEPEYARLLGGVEDAGAAPPGGRVQGVSPTEYRINVLPLGGYVRMLGQDDLRPGDAADDRAPDSYFMRPVWKRMVIISAGVVANVVTAACVFMLVFYLGLQTSPAKVGRVRPGSPAALAIASNALSLGVEEPGLMTGDTIVSANARRLHSFDDLALASAMARRGEPVRLVVDRPGVPVDLHFEIVPEVGEVTGLLELGIEPSRSPLILPARSRADRRAWADAAPRLGLPGVEPGMTLVRAGQRTPVIDASELQQAVDDSLGEPLFLAFEGAGRRVDLTITPRPRLQVDHLDTPIGRVAVEHLLGLTPVMRVGPLGPADAAYAKGLRQGDVFARLGSVEFPSIHDGIAEIRAHKGRRIDAVVLRREQPDAASTPITLSLRVDRSGGGRIGFAADDTAAADSIVARPLDSVLVGRRAGESRPTAVGGLDLPPGSRIIAVDGASVRTLHEARDALRRATLPAAVREAGATVTLQVELPLPPDASGVGPPRAFVAWSIPESDVRALHRLGWAAPFPLDVFEPESILLRARGPLSAVAMGARETNRVMLMTYATLSRLVVDKTVRIEHLKGPVGIAHLGTRLAQRGPVWLLFLMAVVSVNLAVINFLPLPILDGGQFVLLLWEQVRGRPVPIPVQNVITLAGLLLIGSLFAIVTFNDIMHLFTG